MRKKSFSWLRQKVNKRIDAYGYDADDSGTDLCLWLWDDAASRQDISTVLSILIEFEATEYSFSKFRGYSIRMKFQIFPILSLCVVYGGVACGGVVRVWRVWRVSVCVLPARPVAIIASIVVLNLFDVTSWRPITQFSIAWFSGLSGLTITRLTITWFTVTWFTVTRLAWFTVAWFTITYLTVSITIMWHWSLTSWLIWPKNGKIIG